MSMTEIIAGLVLFLLFGVTLVLGLHWQNQVEAHLNATNMQTVETRAVFTSMRDTFTLWDGLFVFAVLVFGFASILGAWMVRSHPAFFILSVLMLLVIILISAVFSNLYYAAVENLAEAGNFPGVTSVMQRLPYIMLGIAFMIAFVQYARPAGPTVIS